MTAQTTRAVLFAIARTEDMIVRTSGEYPECWETDVSRTAPPTKVAELFVGEPKVTP
jgi:hypothetical protein